MNRVGSQMRRQVAAGCAAALLLLGSPAAQAGWKDEVGTLRIGMLARPGSGAVVPGASAIERAYANALGIPVDIFVARDFAALIDAQASGRIQYAIFSATAYAAAWRRCGCVEPLAAPISEDGTPGLRAVLIVAKADAGGEGRRIAAVPQSVVADLLPGLAGPQARPAGARPDDEIVRVGSMSVAERMFAEGEIDGLYGWAPERVGGPDAGTLARLAAMGVAPGDVEIVWTSQPVRFGPHAVRADLPAEAKDILKRFLTGLKLADPDVYDLLEEERQGGFLRAGHDDYEAAVEALGGWLPAPAQPSPEGE